MVKEWIIYRFKLPPPRMPSQCKDDFFVNVWTFLPIQLYILQFRGPLSFSLSTHPTNIS